MFTGAKQKFRPTENTLAVFAVQTEFLNLHRKHLEFEIR